LLRGHKIWPTLQTVNEIQCKSIKYEFAGALVLLLCSKHAKKKNLKKKYIILVLKNTNFNLSTVKNTIKMINRDKW
jgi:hypothetical protein